MSRIDTYIAQTPGKSEGDFNDLRSRLDFMDVADYEKVITRGKNWQLFAPVFRSKADCQRYLTDFRNFRNATKHGRDVDTVLDLNAQAAITWLAKAMQIDLTDHGITW